MDFGVHVVDLYHFLLRPAWSLVSCVHDGFHGPEGLAELELLANGASVSIRLSRYYAQENVAHMVFERAEVTFGVYDARSYVVRSRSRKSAGLTASTASGGDKPVAEALLLNFLAACEYREPPVCDAASSLPVIELLDTAYRVAERYPPLVGAV
jgi:hypothetical protein